MYVIVIVMNWFYQEPYIIHSNTTPVALKHDHISREMVFFSTSPFRVTSPGGQEYIAKHD